MCVCVVPGNGIKEQHVSIKFFCWLFENVIYLSFPCSFNPHYTQMLEQQNKLLKGRITETRRLFQEERKQKKLLAQKLKSITEITKEGISATVEAVVTIQ